MPWTCSRKITRAWFLRKGSKSTSVTDSRSLFCESGHQNNHCLYLNISVFRSKIEGGHILKKIFLSMTLQHVRNHVMRFKKFVNKENYPHDSFIFTWFSLPFFFFNSLFIILHYSDFKIAIIITHLSAMINGIILWLKHITRFFFKVKMCI